MIKFKGYPHVYSAEQFDVDWFNNIFLPLTDKMQHLVSHFQQWGPADTLVGKIMIPLFYTKSLRTEVCLKMAMHYLGGTVIPIDSNAGEFSSTRYQFPNTSDVEKLRDTIRVICSYGPSVIALRYNHNNGSAIAAEVSSVPIISAGDSEPGEHPIQALADWRTIVKHRGSMKGLKIAMVGDVANARAIQSLLPVVAKHESVTVYSVAPYPCQLKGEALEHFKKQGVEIITSNDLREVAGLVDVIYLTQPDIYVGRELNLDNPSNGHLILDSETLSLVRENAAIMHPLPRGKELPKGVDSDPRALYLTKQTESGLFAWMALLETILTPE